MNPLDPFLRKTHIAYFTGSDIWLNTPLPPLEALGTSGMKAALNGVLNLSVVDGWWAEAWIEGVTGWAIGDREGNDDGADCLYRKLAEQVLPLYYDDYGPVDLDDEASDQQDRLLLQ